MRYRVNPPELRALVAWPANTGEDAYAIWDDDD